jgi:hypothetical protein
MQECRLAGSGAADIDRRADNIPVTGRQPAESLFGNRIEFIFLLVAQVFAA